jgi:hypothetical protein
MVDENEISRGNQEGAVVELDYFLSLCKNAVPPELQSGKFVPVELVDTHRNNILKKDDKPLKVPVDALSFDDLLAQKKEAVDENLEGAYPVVILGVIRKRKWLFGKKTEHFFGLPAVLQVLDDDEEYRYRLMGVKETGTESKVLRGRDGTVPHLRGIKIHFVLGDNVTDPKP